jgi:DUF4097 and DUF4098 domain-containing protein YvlB
VASASVKGPVTLRLATLAADVEMVAGGDKQVRALLSDGDGQGVAVVAVAEDRVELQFGGHRQLRNGRLRVELPRRSALEVTTVSGSLRVTATAGDVRFRSMSGDVAVSGVVGVDVSTVSGEIAVREAAGPVRVKTVSGDVRASSAQGPSAQLEFASTSGDLAWSGVCGAHCRVTAQTVSGDVELRFDPRSSFDLCFQSHSGDLGDELQMTMVRSGQKHGPGTDLESRYGKGEGVVELRSFSGDVRIRKR